MRPPTRPPHAPARAITRGYCVPFDSMDGTVAWTTSTAVYIGDPRRAMVVLRDARSFVAGTHSPTSVVVDGIDLRAWRLGTSCSIRAGELSASGTTIDLRDAAVWEPPAPVDPTTITGLDRAARVIRYVAGERLDEVEDRIGPRMRALVAAVADANGHAVDTSLRSLVGFGPGLTPSGDDALVGVLCALGRAGEADLATALREPMRALLHRTTPVSIHSLRLALDGHVAEATVAVVDAALGARTAAARSGHAARSGDARVHRNVETLLGVGATTGADTLVGVLAGLATVAFARTARRPPGAATAVLAAARAAR